MTEAVAFKSWNEMSGQVDDNAQVGLTMQAARYNIETPSFPTHPAPAPETNVAVQVENNEAALEEMTEAILPPVTNSTSGDTRDHHDIHGGTGKCGRRDRSMCVDCRQRAIFFLP
jgi:hypothetical protein